MENKDLSHLKAGDEVIVIDGGFARRTRLAKIERTTNTQIIVGATRYYSKNGYMVGKSSYSPPRIVEPTPELRAKAKEEALRAWFENFSAKQMPLNVLRAMYAAYKSETTEGKSKS